MARDALGGAVQVSSQQRSEAAALRALSDAVASGDIDAAMAGAEQLAPGVLAVHPRVAFALHCQKFCELVSSPARAACT